MSTENAQQIPVNIVGSSAFGLSPKISLEKTYNMYISDNWMVSFPGYKAVALESASGKGRGLFRSIRGNFLIAVIGSGVYRISTNLGATLVGTIQTISSEVFIDENLSNQICIVDGLKAYIYHYDGTSGTLTEQTLFQSNGSTVVVPNYVSFHNSYFLIASSPSSTDPQNWYAYSRASDTTIAYNSDYRISTKPDKAIAVVRIPGRGNNVMVFGSAVTEIWNNSPTTVAGVAVQYQRVSSYSINNGCVSVSTIATSDDMVIWLSQNEFNSPVIMTSNGSETQQISTDGISHLMETIVYPEQSTALFFRQNGHMFYCLTFYNKADNVSIMYDFNTKQFFHISDHNLNYHPAREVVYFEEKSYFISLNDGVMYQIGDEFNDANGHVIPRIRICKAIRKEDSSTFRAGMFTFWLEQGVNDFFIGYAAEGVMINESGQVLINESDQIMLVENGGYFLNNNRPRVDMSFSKDGGRSFSNVVSKELNPQGEHRNQIRWHRLGQANEFMIQLRFWGFQTFTARDGIVEVF